MCSFYKNQLITWKQAYNIWKLSKTLNLLFWKSAQGNSLKFFTVVVTNQDFLILKIHAVFMAKHLTKPLNHNEY